MVDLKRYDFEINHIINELECMEKGDFHEVDKRTGSPSAKKMAKDIKECFVDLIDKIINEKEGTFELVDKIAIDK